MNDLTIVAEAQQLHQDIMIQEQVAAQSLTQIACDLKQMRDRHLYTHLGYKDFEEYCEKATKTGKRQAYNLISLVETYKLDGLERLKNLGSTKLLVLKNLSPADREELIPEAEELSVRELKERIKVLTDKNEQLTFDLQGVQQESHDEVSELKAEIEELKSGKRREIENAAYYKEMADKLTAGRYDVEKQLAALEEQNKKLIAENKALSKKPVEVAVAEPSAEDIAKIKVEAVKEAEAKAKAEYDKRLKSEIEKVQSIAQPKAAPSEAKELLKYRFQNIQTAFNEAMDTVKSLSTTTEKVKGKGALLNVVEQMQKLVLAMETGGNE